MFPQIFIYHKPAQIKKNHNKQTSHGQARILWAAQNNQLDLVKEMVGAAPGLVGARDEDLYTPLHRAAYNNHIQERDDLLFKGHCS